MSRNNSGVGIKLSQMTIRQLELHMERIKKRMEKCDAPKDRIDAKLAEVEMRYKVSQIPIINGRR